jgi:hypothetical protein
VRWTGSRIDRSPKPEEVANSIAFLASKRVAAVIGTAYAIDGGGGPQHERCRTHFGENSGSRGLDAHPRCYFSK